MAPSHMNLIREFEEEVVVISQEQTVFSVAKNLHVAATRQACNFSSSVPYESVGSAERMFRNIVAGKGLPHINNIMDINNLISVSSGYSVGSYDVNLVTGPVEFRWSDAHTLYSGLSEDDVNISCLPALFDVHGPFGCPVGDSCRAAIMPGMRDIISVIYSFDGRGNLDRWMQRFSSVLINFCDVEEIRTQVI